MTNDLLRKYKSLYSSTTNSFGTGTSETITPATVTGLPTDTDICLTFDRSVTGKIERIIGTITGGNFVIKERGVDNTTDQAHTSPTVEMVWNAKDWNDAVDAFLVGHTQTGAHKSQLVTDLKATGAVVNTGTSDVTIVTPKALADSNAVFTTKTQTLTNKTLTSPKVGTAILDTNGNEVIETPATADAVNQIKITNAATGNNPTIEASGDNTYIPLLLKGKSASPRVSGTYDNGNLTGAVTIDCKKGTRQKGTLTGNVTITLANPTEGECLELFLFQNATGGRTISFSTTIIWQDNTTPTWTTTASKLNSMALRYENSTWYGVGAKFA